MLNFNCSQCNKSFTRNTNDSYNVTKRGGKPFCSKLCFNKSQNTKVEIKCTNCEALIYKKPSELKKVKNSFCSHQCSASYNTKHRKTGTRRSKLEIYIESKLLSLYPDIQILFNDKSIINSELDIYIPSLKLAFELNGIFHYEPIYGGEKLDQIQNNDHRKFKLCIENSISLCVIDTSSQKYFKEESSKKFLNIIISIIDKELRKGSELN